jgi:hypothetical protein
VTSVSAGHQGLTVHVVAGEDSNLRSFRDGFTVLRRQSWDDQRKRPCPNNFRAYSPQTADISRRQPWPTGRRPGARPRTAEVPGGHAAFADFVRRGVGHAAPSRIAITADDHSAPAEYGAA